MSLENAHRLVIKIGSALLVDARGRLRRAWLEALADDIAEQRSRGREVVIVSSGAIALGCGALDFGRRTLGLGTELKSDFDGGTQATGEIRASMRF